MRQYLFIIILTGIVTFLATWVVWKVAMRFRLHPPVRERDVHTTPTPRLGGVAIVMGIMAAFAVSSANPHFSLLWSEPQRVWAILGAVLLIAIVGVLDDLWDLDWMIKLACQIVAACIVAIGGELQIFTLPLGNLTVLPSGWSIFLTVASLVLVMNAVNFIDGLDGLLTGVFLIANSVFLVYTYMVVRDTGATAYFNLATLIAAVIVGACIGFLPFNWNPARMFLGDSGALTMGLLMGTGAVAITFQLPPSVLESGDLQNSQLLGAFIPILLPVILMAIPLLDFFLAVSRRSWSGRSPMSPDRKHLHHRMLAIGHRPLQATLIFYAWSAIGSMSVLLMYVATREKWIGGFWIGVVFALIGFVLCTVLTITPSRTTTNAVPSSALNETDAR